MPSINSEDEDRTNGTHNSNANVVGLWTWGEGVVQGDALDDSWGEGVVQGDALDDSWGEGVVQGDAPDDSAVSSISPLEVSNRSAIDSNTPSALSHSPRSAIKKSSLLDLNAAALDSPSNQMSKKTDETEDDECESHDSMVQTIDKEEEKDEDDEQMFTKDKRIKAVTENVELNPVKMFDKDNGCQSTVTEEEKLAHVRQAVEDALNRALSTFLQNQDSKLYESLELSNPKSNPKQPLKPRRRSGLKPSGSFEGAPTVGNNINSSKPRMKQKRRSSMASTLSYHNASTVDSSTVNTPWWESSEAYVDDSEKKKKKHLKPQRPSSL